MILGKRYKPSRVKISSWSRATKTRQQFCHRGFTCHSNLWFVLLAHFDCLKTSLWHDFFFRGLSNWNLSNSTSSYGFSLASFLRINMNFCLDLPFTYRRRPALRWLLNIIALYSNIHLPLNYCNPDQFDLDLTSLPLPLVQQALERGALHKHKWDGTAVITQIKSNQIANKFMASKLRCLLNWQ